MVSLKLLLLRFMLRKEKQEMAVIYASLIIKGKRTYESVPEVIKPQVKQVLIDLEVWDLLMEGNAE